MWAMFHHPYLVDSGVADYNTDRILFHHTILIMSISSVLRNREEHIIMGFSEHIFWAHRYTVLNWTELNSSVALCDNFIYALLLLLHLFRSACFVSEQVATAMGSLPTSSTLPLPPPSRSSPHPPPLHSSPLFHFVLTASILPTSDTTPFPPPTLIPIISTFPSAFSVSSTYPFTNAFQFVIFQPIISTPNLTSSSHLEFIFWNCICLSFRP